MRQRTAHYVHWIEGYARKHKIPLIWVPRDAKGKPLKHEDVVGPALQRVRRAKRFGVRKKSEMRTSSASWEI